MEVAFSPDGSLLATSDQTAGAALLIDPAAGTLTKEVWLRGQPRGLCWAPDGNRLYVAEYGAATVAEIDAKRGKVTRRIGVGMYPRGVNVTREGKLLLAANSATHTVSVVDLEKGREKKRIPVPREPFAIAVDSRRSRALVSNHLPHGRANSSDYAPVVSVLNLKTLQLQQNISLPPGSTGVRDVEIGPGGKWAYVVHTVGRTGVPLTQFARGWVNTHAVSILDMENLRRYATVLLDHITEGAADPWGLICSRDGKTLWVTLSGTHELARIRLDRLHSYMEGKLPDGHPLARKENNPPGAENIWLEIKNDLSMRRELVNRLSALYTADLIERVSLPGKGPRGLDQSAHDGRLAVAEYFSGRVLLLKPENGNVVGRVEPAPNRKPDKVRRGEIVFHDATACFQKWSSCATCHPNGARVDGLNWDLPNDGVGNPKSLKSLLLSHRTPPTTWRGIRSGMTVSSQAGFVFLQREPGPERLGAVLAYLESLEPQPSPYRREDGGLTAAARRGKKIFESNKAGCARCHPAPLYTDLQSHDVGTREPYDRSAEFDTPSLIEAYRTEPYLHDGSAPTLRDVLTVKNPEDEHGVTSHLDDDQIQDLVEYMLSLDRVGPPEVTRHRTEEKR